MIGRFLLSALLVASTATVGARAWIIQGGGTPAVYSGPGDIHSFTSWWSSTFAFSAATRGTKAVKLCNGGVCADVNSDATTGIVANTPTINGAACNNSTHICNIDTVYDKAGTADMLQATDANRPVFVVDGYATGIPCASFTRANSVELKTTAGTASSLTNIMEAVFKRNTGQSANQNGIFFVASDYFYHESNADNVSAYGGNAVVPVTLTDNTWGAGAINFKGSGNSYINVNGSTATGVTGGNNFTATQCIGSFCGSGYYDGFICEAGFIGTTDSTATVDSLVTNARGALRYNF